MRLTTRRGVLAAVATAVVALATNAQQPDGIRRLGVLIAFPAGHPLAKAYTTAVVQALERLGWIEGKTIRITYRYAAGDPALFKTYAAELVDMAPDAILASTAPALVALREQTRAIP